MGWKFGELCQVHSPNDQDSLLFPQCELITPSQHGYVDPKPIKNLSFIIVLNEDDERSIKVLSPAGIGWVRKIRVKKCPEF